MGKYLQIYEPPFVIFHNPQLAPDLLLGNLPTSGFPARTRTGLNAAVAETGVMKE
jgi:hypothetical protein